MTADEVEPTPTPTPTPTPVVTTGPTPGVTAGTTPGVTAGPTPVVTRGARLWYGFAQALVETVCRLMWRIDIVGQENVPDGPFILAPVHRSYIDTLLAACVTRRRVRFMAKHGVWKYKAVGTLLTSLGGFTVHRGTADRESMRICEDALRGGEPVVLFPEGTRQSGPIVQPLLDGAVFIAGRANVPILPVGIGGSEWAMPKGARMLHPVKVAVTIGQPIELPRSAAGRVSRRQVAESTQALRETLQGLFDESLRRAGRAGTPS